MDKRKVIDQIRSYLEEEFIELTLGVRNEETAAHTPPSAPAPHSIEDASLRAAELQRLLNMYRFLPVREFGPDDVACPSALVELEFKNTTAFYLIVPQGGGLVTSVDGRPVQVVTPNSPIGEALLGHKMGDTIEVEMKESTRKYRVVSIR